MKRLCFRCEYRIHYNELEYEKRGSGHAPRYECKLDGSVNSCYMFRPVVPVAVTRSDDEIRRYGNDRPFGGVVGARVVIAEDQPDFIITYQNLENGTHLLYNYLVKKGKD